MMIATSMYERRWRRRTSIINLNDFKIDFTHTGKSDYTHVIVTVDRICGKHTLTEKSNATKSLFKDRMTSERGNF